jgi:hypothetical protein
VEMTVSDAVRMQDVFKGSFGRDSGGCVNLGHQVDVPGKVCTAPEGGGSTVIPIWTRLPQQTLLLRAFPPALAIMVIMKGVRIYGSFLGLSQIAALHERT